VQTTRDLEDAKVRLVQHQDLHKELTRSHSDFKAFHKETVNRMDLQCTELQEAVTRLESELDDSKELRNQQNHEIQTYVTFAASLEENLRSEEILLDSRIKDLANLASHSSEVRHKEETEIADFKANLLAELTTANEQKASLEAKYSASQHQISTLELELHAIEQALSSQRVQLEERCKGLHQHEAVTSAARANYLQEMTRHLQQIENLQSEHEAGCRENQDLKAMLSAAKSENDASVSQLHSLEQALTTQQLHLQARCSKLAEMQVSTSSLKQNVSFEKVKLERELAALRSEFEASAEEAHGLSCDGQLLKETINKEKADHERELSSVRSNLAQAERENQIISAEKGDLESKLAAFDIERAQERNKDEKTVATVATDGSMTDLDGLEAMKSQRNHLEAELAVCQEHSEDKAALEEELSLLRADNLASSTKLQGAMKVNSNLQILVAELRESQMKLESCQASEQPALPQPLETSGCDKMILRLFKRLLCERFSHKNADEISKLLKLDTRAGSVPRADVDKFLKQYKKFKDEFDMQKAFQKLDTQKSGRLTPADFSRVLSKNMALDANAAKSVVDALDHLLYGVDAPKGQDLSISESDFVKILSSPDLN